MDNEKIFYELRDFIDKSWFYDKEVKNCRLINVDHY